MRRRMLLAAAAALLASPRRSPAQGTRRRLGFLAMDESEPTMQSAWLDGLRGHGWIEGKNLTIEYRYSRSRDRLPALAAELAALSPDLLIASAPQPAIALKSATASIPIVFVAVYDPVAIGLVQSLSHPGGNITGLATYVPGDFIAKRIEILREMVPSASKIAILINPGNPVHRQTVAEEVPSTIRNLGVVLPIVEATTAEELDIAFASVAAQHADAIIVFGDPLTIRHAPHVTALAAQHRLPAIYLFRQFADGGLIVYGPDLTDLWRRAGGYVDKILRGSTPSDLPVEQPMKFELIINMKTVKALGLTVPLSLLVRADEVIE
jgi:putative ABC transport system substrate-binding protein